MASDEYRCPHCGAMNPESTRKGDLRITCRVCGGQYEARHLVSSTSIAELAQQVSDGAEQDTPYPWRTCKHEDAVKWNPYNKVVQCHRCGWVFIPEPEMVRASNMALMDVTLYSQLGPAYELAVRKNELYHAMLVVEQCGASTELTEAIKLLGDRMSDMNKDLASALGKLQD